MPSRINIGPEDGPYVAINESSGNLQLEDNSGNVVAEWDEGNAQWDFANNTLNNVDALNSNSVNTEQASIGDPAEQIDRIDGGGLDWSWQWDDTNEWLSIDTSSLEYSDGEIYRLIVRNFYFADQQLRMYVNEQDDGINEGWRYEDSQGNEFDGQNFVEMNDSGSSNAVLSLIAEFGQPPGEAVDSDMSFEFRYPAASIHRFNNPLVRVAGGNVADSGRTIESIQFDVDDPGAGGGVDNPTDATGFDVSLTKVIDL